MNNNNAHDVEALSIMIAEADELDAYALIALLKPHMNGPAFEALALSHDMCPIHLSDLDSCADDDNDELADAAPFEIPFTACRHFRRAV